MHLGILLTLFASFCPPASAAQRGLVQRVQDEAQATARRVSIRLRQAELDGVSIEQAKTDALAPEPGDVRLVGHLSSGVRVADRQGAAWVTAYAPVPGAALPISVAVTARQEVGAGPSPLQAGLMVLAAALLALGVGRRSKTGRRRAVQCDVSELVHSACRTTDGGPVLEVVPGRTDPVVCQPDSVRRVLEVMLGDASRAAGPDGR